MVRPTLYDTPELKKAAACASKHIWYHKNREEQLEKMKDRYHQKAAKEGRQRRSQRVQASSDKSFDEQLCNRLRRRMRVLDGQLRAATNNALIPWAAGVVAEFEDLGVIDGCSYISGHEETLKDKLAIIGRALADIEKEAGLENEYWRDVNEIQQGFSTAYRYIADMWAYAQKGLLLKARKKKELLYQKDRMM
ncbi:hypothetical protein BDZ89DRAFT_1041849 [Hymenopellis radicata]|nr:hypothetical protein BDZ89DRAFT_1041849 [Hymenopellis radicata]